MGEGEYSDELCVGWSRSSRILVVGLLRGRGVCRLARLGVGVRPVAVLAAEVQAVVAGFDPALVRRP